MQLEQRDAAYLWDMLQAADELMEMLADHDLSAFLENRMLVRAIERNIELIGEAARRVSDSTKSGLSEIPWRRIIGQRNILAHEYGQVDHELLFKTASQDIPALADTLRLILDSLESD